MQKITLDAKTAVMVVIGLLGAGGGTGYFTKPEQSALEAEVAAKLDQKYKNKDMLDSIGRVAASVCALRSQVADVQTDMRTLMDTMNAMNRRTGQSIRFPTRAIATTYSMRQP